MKLFTLSLLLLSFVSHASLESDFDSMKENVTESREQQEEAVHKMRVAFENERHEAKLKHIAELKSLTDSMVLGDKAKNKEVRSNIKKKMKAFKAEQKSKRNTMKSEMKAIKKEFKDKRKSYKKEFKAIAKEQRNKNRKKK